MSFKKMLFFSVGLLLLLLVGCEKKLVKHNQAEGIPATYNQLEKNKSPFSDILPRFQADMFVGELPTFDETPKEVQLMRRDKNCEYQNATYVKIELPTNDSRANPNWQLDCDYLDVLGKTDKGEIVYGINTSKHGVVSLLVVDLQNVAPVCDWYIVDTYDIMNPHNYAVSDFDVEIIYGKYPRPNSIEQIWEYHTDEKYNFIRSLIMDSDDEQYFFLRCKENPWLVYELICTYTYDGFIYIYNIPNRGMVLLTEEGENVAQ